jgi:16S rRNA (adenine1518-N6/adenine1519-N6)-dimethyltransferase
VKHIRPIKSFGQSFLTYEPAADRIVDALGLMPDDEVIEIGPGKGVLTSRLVERCRKVTAVEIDERLVEYLRSEFVRISNLEVVLQDFLGFDLSGFRDVVVCGNLPYNVSSQILFRLLDNLPSWRRGVFTLQREFASRMLAAPDNKDYGAVTVLFELWTEREKLFNLEPDCFKPSPDVMSTVISIRRRDKPSCAVKDMELFKKVVKAAFAQRRKTLGNNLNNGLGLDRPALALVEQASGIDLKRRAETLSVVEFALLANSVSNLKSQISKCKLEEESNAHSV